jgi:hypothetical protein
MKKLLYHLWECSHGVLCQFMRKLQRQAFRNRHLAKLILLFKEVITNIKFRQGLSVMVFLAWLINPVFFKKQYLIY